MKQVAINGFGRIGRNILRAILESPRDDYSIVAVNDLAPVETAALLLELDSTHGRLDRAVGFGDGFIEIDGRRIAYMSHRNPEDCDWGGRGIELVMECTGIFTDAEAAGRHIDAGAARVLVSAPCKGADATIVYGVNDSILAAEMTIISNASCTDGVAIRVPTPNVSAVDLVFEPARRMSAEDINAAFVAAANTMAPVLTVTDRPLVSTDFNHDPSSAVVHLDQTRVMPDGMTRVLAWYDNEWGFSNRMLDTAGSILKL
ncbi:MAG: aldehyde dehydrogenase [Alphaproteobacteria bacterium]|nr:aldehyde dehydrogenase [Alphaproteobacteria bacterium]